MKHPLSLPDRKFFASLHGLRGLAVLYVVVSHLGSNGFFLLPIPHDGIGKVGVWIFFALSAFLLTTHLCRDLETASSKVSPILRYVIHRVFRIYPLYIAALIGHWIVGDISKLGLVSHLLLIQGWGELWAIPVEFQYYFVIPFIAVSTAYLPRRSVTALLMAALVVAFLYGIKNPAIVFSNEINIIPKLAPFVLGSVLALLLDKNSFSRRSFYLGWSVLLTVACLVGLLVTTILYRHLDEESLSNFLAPSLSVAIAVSAVALIYAALHVNFIGKILESRLMVLLGEISFSVYLLHMFVIRFVAKILNPPSFAGAWISLGLCILCASVSYWAIERPGIHAGRNISKRLRD